MIKIFVCVLLACMVGQSASKCPVVQEDQVNQTKKEASIMMIKIFAVLFLASSLQQIVAEDLCWCICPYQDNPIYAYLCNPKNTCPKDNEGWCYVSCKSDCRDRMPGPRANTCISEIACNMSIPLRNGK